MYSRAGCAFFGGWKAMKEQEMKFIFLLEWNFFFVFLISFDFLGSNQPEYRERAGAANFFPFFIQHRQRQRVWMPRESRENCERNFPTFPRDGVEETLVSNFLLFLQILLLFCFAFDSHCRLLTWKFHVPIAEAIMKVRRSKKPFETFINLYGLHQDDIQRRFSSNFHVERFFISFLLPSIALCSLLTHSLSFSLDFPLLYQSLFFLLQGKSRGWGWGSKGKLCTFSMKFHDFITYFWCSFDGSCVCLLTIFTFHSLSSTFTPWQIVGIKFPTKESIKNSNYESELAKSNSLNSHTEWNFDFRVGNCFMYAQSTSRQLDTFLFF